ncbi:cytochrome P450 [Marivita hallyeonensis]|uniref:Unspecific monooxygenase n=1 Tax=Marivita hallyeonensis TaxID=996342 RepID=A0A1M5RDW0_9RHOB|nr:cytochrome P450 [Marivita hallyeonensis]SHH24505.1 unspecific monooxygenase [Marivita hallyeonensis]
MLRVVQSPIDPAFVQNPYPFYDRLRQAGDLVWWEDYAMPCAVSYAAVHALFRDRRFGREVPPEQAVTPPAYLKPFYDVEAHSMLELEPPRHTRLRGLVLRAFTSRRIKALAPEIAALAHARIDQFPVNQPFDLLPAYCQPIPVIVIARLLGVPDEMADQLLRWSNAMVAMYQAGRSHETEVRAAKAATEFTTFLRDYIDRRRAKPADDLITHLIAAEEHGKKLSTEELITTCILLLNAGHEATVHTLGNGVKTLLNHAITISTETADLTCEEILRFDPPLHMFTRYAYEEVDAFGHTFRRGDQVALLLAAANRDPAQWEDPNQFNPTRAITQNTSFGGGLHFCVGAPLARLEMQIALPILFDRCPSLSIAEPPVFADSYHFHGLERLMVTTA